jgi:SET domain-containing protein
MQKLTEMTFVSDSKIHGRGLFALQAIKKGTLLGYLEGRPTTVDGSYVLWLNDSEGFEVSCNLKYINHSEQPNACYYDDLSVVAIRAIKTGDEITHNYESSDW